MSKHRQSDPREKAERSNVTVSELTWALRRATRTHALVAGALASRMAIGATDAKAIDEIMEHPGIGPVELAGTLGITTASATALLDRLEETHHVVRRSHPTDRRRVALYPTRRAEQQFVKHLGPLIDLIAEVERSLRADEREIVLRYLEGITSAWQRFLDSSPTRTRP